MKCAVRNASAKIYAAADGFATPGLVKTSPAARIGTRDHTRSDRGGCVCRRPGRLRGGRNDCTCERSWWVRMLAIVVGAHAGDQGDCVGGGGTTARAGGRSSRARWRSFLCREATGCFPCCASALYYHLTPRKHRRDRTRLRRSYPDQEAPWPSTPPLDSKRLPSCPRSG